MAGDTQTALRALRAIGRWQRVAQAHVFLGGMSCACGVGFAGITAGGYEQDLFDYLYAGHGNNEQAAALFAAAGYDKDQGAGGDLIKLLQALTQGGLPSTLADPLLGDLETAIDSLDRVHS